MADHLGIRFRDRPADATGDVPAYATYWDAITDLIEQAIENLVKHGLFEGLLTSPEFSRTNLVVSFETFQCVTEDGIYCHLFADDVTHDAADPTNPRIDIICVKPTIQKDESEEITQTGEVVIEKGTAAAKPLVPDTPSGYLKVLEVDIPAEPAEVTLRAWTPMYVLPVMFRPKAQATPDMTIRVNFGRGYISGNTLLDKDVQNSPEFTAPAANKCSIDILHIDSNGTLAITQGDEVDLPNEPTAPTYPTDKMVICEVYLEAGDTVIYQWQIKDVRPFLNLGVGLKNIVEDTTPELGGDLDAKYKRIYDIKWLDLKAPTELTIDTGAITITQSFHTVDTEGEAGSDDLVTINGGSVGRVLILRAENDGRTVVIKHGTGNIWLKGKADISLDDLEDGLILIYTAGSKWADLGVLGGGYTNLTSFVDQTAWRIFYSNTDGDVIELVLGADGTYLKSNGAAAAPTWATPAGAGDMLKATYDVDEDDIVDKVKGLDLATASELTIADGAITVTQSVHTVDTQGDAGSDDLDTINGGATVQLIILRAENDAHTVVVKHNTGNIWLKRKKDLSLDDLEDGLMLFWDGTKWIDVGAWDEGTIGFSFAIPIDTPETVGADKGVFHFAPGVAGTIDEVYLMAKTAPGAGKTFTPDVNKAGVTIFTNQANRPSLVDTAKTATSGTPDVTTFAKNDLFTVDVDVSTATTAVADVILFIRGKQKVA